MNIDEFKKVFSEKLAAMSDEELERKLEEIGCRKIIDGKILVPFELVPAGTHVYEFSSDKDSLFVRTHCLANETPWEGKDVWVDAGTVLLDENYIL